MIPDNITREHLLNAIEEIKENGIPPGRQSSTYDLIYEGNAYPPKLVISFANKYANDIELSHDEFKGGDETPAFKLLRNYGFEIVKKTDSNVFHQLIDKYKKIIKSKGLDEESQYCLIFVEKPDKVNTLLRTKLNTLTGVK